MYLWTHHTYPIVHRYYDFNHISPLHRYYYTWHHLCLLHATLIHGYTISLDIIIAYICIVVPWNSMHSYFMFLHRCYIDSPVCMHWLSLYSCCVDHYLYYMNDCYMDIIVFPLLILIFPLLDIWDVDIWCVELCATWTKAMGATSRIPHLPFFVSRYLVSCYQQSSCPIIVLHVPCTVLIFIYCVV